MKNGIGEPVRRKEDLRLVTGRGEFSDDLNLPRQAHAAILRAPHGHARILRIDTTAAKAAPGVLAVLTGSDYVAEGLKPIPNNPLPPDLPLQNRDGSKIVVPPDHPLAVDKVRHVGEGVALIVAETRAQAQDAAELVQVVYDVLPAVVEVGSAVAKGAAQIWDEVPNNLMIDGERGDKAATDAAFAQAAHVTRLQIKNNRVTGLPLEPLACVGEHDATTGQMTLHAGTQGILIQKRALCGVFGVDGDKMRVITRDVGGGFGTRNLIYRESVLVVWAARRVGRPVKYRADRSEAFIADPYGRDLTSTVELALDAQGKFLGIRAHNIQNTGSQAIHLIPLLRGSAVANGVYAIPAIHLRLQAVFTNTTPTSTYRGAGRPESIFMIERLIDTAAAEMGIDRVKLRRMNFIQPKMLPYINSVQTRYDSGEFDANMMRALDMVDAKDFPARRRAAKKRGKLRGLGWGNYIETATGIPPERAVIKVNPERIDITLGTQASGQGHETMFAQMMVDMLGAKFDDVRLVHGDSDVVKMGSGSHSCRSMRLGGLLLGRASAEIVEKGRTLAARALQADKEKIEFADGQFRVVGSERAIGLLQLAGLAPELSAPEPVTLEASAETTTMLPTFPNGCHACEVEVDPETGAVEIVRYVAVDDCWPRAQSPAARRPDAWSTVQGVGQALLEDCVYEEGSGQLLSGSFMDYAMPRARMFPSFKVENNEVLAPNNPLGVKGGGEGGTTGAPPAVINAVVDALREVGVRELQMPATPHRVWQAIRACEGRARLLSVIARSEATKQSRAAHDALDCFASLAMTALLSDVTSVFGACALWPARRAKRRSRSRTACGLSPASICGSLRRSSCRACRQRPSRGGTDAAPRAVEVGDSDLVDVEREVERRRDRTAPTVPSTAMRAPKPSFTTVSSVSASQTPAATSAIASRFSACCSRLPMKPGISRRTCTGLAGVAQQFDRFLHDRVRWSFRSG